MGATLQNNIPMQEILKPTGYDIPLSVQDKTWGEATSGSAVIEDNKTVSIIANGTVEITPSSGKDAMAKVTASVNVPSKEEQTKSVTITENGTTTVTPDSGKVLSSVSITTNVSGGGGGGGGGASFPDDIYAMWMAYVPDAFTDKTITIGANNKDIYVIHCPNNTTSTGDVSKIYSTYNFIKLTPGETKVIDVASPDSVSFTLNSENTSVGISYTGHTVGYNNRFIVIAVNR